MVAIFQPLLLKGLTHHSTQNLLMIKGEHFSIQKGAFTETKTNLVHKKQQSNIQRNKAHSNSFIKTSVHMRRRAVLYGNARVDYHL